MRAVTWDVSWKSFPYCFLNENFVGGFICRMTNCWMLMLSQHVPGLHHRPRVTQVWGTLLACLYLSSLGYVTNDIMVSKAKTLCHGSSEMVLLA